VNTENAEAVIWWLYVVRTTQNSLYTGITTDVQRRLSEHENEDGRNKGAKALRGKGPLEIVFKIEVGNRSDALKMEYRVKRLSRTEKEWLVDATSNIEELKAWLQDK